MTGRGLNIFFLIINTAFIVLGVVVVGTWFLTGTPQASIVVMWCFVIVFHTLSFALNWSILLDKADN